MKSSFLSPRTGLAALLFASFSALGASPNLFDPAALDSRITLSNCVGTYEIGVAGKVIALNTSKAIHKKFDRDAFASGMFDAMEWDLVLLPVAPILLPFQLVGSTLDARVLKCNDKDLEKWRRFVASQETVISSAENDGVMIQISPKGELAKTATPVNRAPGLPSTREERRLAEKLAASIVVDPRTDSLVCEAYENYGLELSLNGNLIVQDRFEGDAHRMPQAFCAEVNSKLAQARANGQVLALSNVQSGSSRNVEIWLAKRR